jgi:hypothetical protein
MQGSRAAVQRWARRQRQVSTRIAREERRSPRSLSAALAHVDQLRQLAADLGATSTSPRAQQENLAFHLTWQRVRRAFGVG